VSSRVVITLFAFSGNYNAPPGVWSNSQLVGSKVMAPRKLQHSFSNYSSAPALHLQLDWRIEAVFQNRAQNSFRIPE
jgi:hypothetical protein